MHIKNNKIGVFMACFLAYFALIPLAFGKDYKIEAIIFEHNNPGQIMESSQYQPPRLLASEESTWAVPISMLKEQADAIKRSSNYRFLHHLSWGQQALPYSKSAVYSVAEQDIHGFIKVYANQLLFANIDLEFDGFRLSEKRRLKLNERHYFDHPRFGVLLRVSRLITENQ